MGIFDKLSKGFASKALEDIVKNVAENISQNADKGANRNTSQQTAQTPIANVWANPAANVDIGNYFAEILASEFGQYQIRRDIPLGEFGVDGRPFDFGLYQNGQLVSVVVLAGHNKTRNHPYWNSEKLAKSLNIPFINFFTHMPNERGFVIDRINRLMRRG